MSPSLLVQKNKPAPRRGLLFDTRQRVIYFSLEQS